MDRNVASSASVIVFKQLGVLQTRFNRPELRDLVERATQELASVPGGKRRWSFCYSPNFVYIPPLDALRKNNGRSRTLASQPARQYLLKGIVRCAYCLIPMWAQTYYSGWRYYREHPNSRSHGP